MSDDKQVAKFLNDLMATDEDKYALVQALRDTVIEQYPDVSERMMYGGIMFSLGKDFGGLFPYKNHVSFEFSLGCLLQDNEKLLEGKGKYRRHLKLTSTADIETKQVCDFVKQAVALVATI